MNLREFTERINSLLSEDRLAEALTFSRQAYESADSSNVKSAALFWIGRLLFRLGFYEELGNLIRKHRRELESQQSLYLRIRVLELEMNYFLETGELAKARSILGKLRSTEIANDPMVCLFRDIAVGTYYVKTADFRRGEEIFQELSDRLVKWGKKLRGTNEAFFLCLCKLMRGDFEGFFRILSQVGVPGTPTWDDLWLSGLVITGRHDDAIPMLNGLLAKFRGEDMYKGIVSATSNLAVAWSALGDPEKARLYIDVALAYGRNIPRYSFEVEAVALALLPPDHFRIAKLRNLREESLKRGFMRAWFYASYAFADALLVDNIEIEAAAVIKELFEKANEKGAWGLVYFMAQMRPEPLRLAREMFPKIRAIKEAPLYITAFQKILPVVRLRFFGGCQVIGPEKHLAVAQRKDADVLALIAVERKNPRTKESIAEMVWPDSPLPKAMRNLYNSISRIKALIKGVGISVPSSRFKGPGRLPLDFRTDAEEFESMVEAGRALIRAGQSDRAVVFYEKAVEIYGGEFLPDSRMRWTQELRDLYRGMFVEVLVFLSGYHLKASPEKSLHYAYRAMEADPLNEEACLAALSILVRIGKKTEAKRLYDRFTEDYRKTIGMEPAIRWPLE